MIECQKNNSFLFVFSCIGVDLEPSQAPSHYKGKFCGLLAPKRESHTRFLISKIFHVRPIAELFLLLNVRHPAKKLLEKYAREQLVLTLNKNGPTTKGLMNKNVQSQTFRSLQRALEGGGRLIYNHLERF